MLKNLVQRYLPRKYYAPIRRVQYGVPARAASVLRPAVWRVYGRHPVPDSGPSEQKIFVSGSPKSISPEPIPKRIWLYWEQPEKPEVVAALNDDVARKNPDHEVVLLNQDNASDYVPEYREWNKFLLPQHKSDLLRLYLMSRYGGIWLDSSIYLGESLAWVHSWAAHQSLDFVGFYNDTLEGPDYPMLESWFLAAAPGNPFIQRWLDYTAPMAQRGIDDCFDSLLHRPECVAASDRVPNPRVRVIYIANQAAFEDGVACRMGLLRARDEAFSFAEKYSRNTWELAMNWTVRPAPERSPILVKMTQRDRSIIMAYDEAGLTRRESLIGTVLHSYRKAKLAA